MIYGAVKIYFNGSIFLLKILYVFLFVHLPFFFFRTPYLVEEMSCIADFSYAYFFIDEKMCFVLLFNAGLNALKGTIDVFLRE